MSRKVGDSNTAGGATTGRRPPEDAPVPPRRAYLAPKLDCYGNVRDLTAAPSPGSFESGPGAGFKGV